ncbi:hypothetical protein [Celeribacter litoreus]|uniref:hypothetical protein n=1 Tax=Celeribacter litoreus TaxID=2876714 RepID=UPI001CC9D203|nr:hypothetical protein [Celeribacter litoreus]MCA0044353.1 hypothetical protein [Celeribacter litoreus]
MYTDFILVLGSVLILLALPSAVRAYSEDQFPRFAAGMFVVGGVLVTSAYVLHPDGYRLSDVPLALVRVLGRIF